METGKLIAAAVGGGLLVAISVTLVEVDPVRPKTAILTDNRFTHADDNASTPQVELLSAESKVVTGTATDSEEEEDTTSGEVSTGWYSSYNDKSGICELRAHRNFPGNDRSDDSRFMWSNDVNDRISLVIPMGNVPVSEPVNPSFDLWRAGGADNHPFAHILPYANYFDFRPVPGSAAGNSRQLAVSGDEQTSDYWANERQRQSFSNWGANRLYRQLPRAVSVQKMYRKPL